MYSVFYKFDNRTQHLISLRDPDTTLLDGPSTSGLSSSLAAATGATAVAAAAVTNAQCLESHNSPDTTSENLTLYNNQQQISPTTTYSSTSTAPLISPSQSPLELSNYSTPSLINNNNTTPTTPTTTTMPAKSHQPIPVIVTTTTTAEIMEDTNSLQENRFSLLAGKDIVTNELDIYTLPSPPTTNLNSQENLNHSSGTTVSQITPSGSPHKLNNGSQNGSVNNSPVKKKQQHRNHNNNQGDVNSIESITEDTVSEKIPSANLDWIDAVVQERQDREILAKPKKKKKKKNVKELDQLDGVPMKESSTDAASVKEEDEKVVKCLYYTLMCCDCTIS
ncbi:cell wall protein DAN4 isoform X3 [Lucilia sericata]|uniref:cell wall protein DAN4 isoform X3 n=1 Tax=Lucilia sericata TaxID=13632 RepID=UPI0018A8024E|nr:cell wall protein DAN4 isoform X3 [Lucilia sericata]XP_037807083.1 cell wall protein DAN4 isoform X3 [Lucilia sericata]